MGKTLKYVSEFTFPSAGKTDAKGYAQGGPPAMANRPAAQQQALQQRLAQQMVQARAAQKMQQPPGRPMVPPQGAIPAQMPQRPMPGQAPRGPMPGMAKGGMAMGGMKSTKPAASPAPKSDMLYSKKENTAKTLLSDGKGAPMPHARGSVNMAKGGMSKVGKVMDEYKAGELHSGSKTGPVVSNRKQAIAIGMSEARKASKK